MGSIAVINFISRQKTQTRQGLSALLNYCAKNAKTIHDGRKLVTGVNCVARSAYNEMMNTKLRYKKADGRMYYHLLQSFHPDENLTPETAHEIALRFAEENFPGYEILVATHVDRDHIHSHFVINSVNAESGYKYHSDNKEIQRLRDSSDKLCLEYGLSVIESAPSKIKGMSSREYRAADKCQSWKLDLAIAIDEVMCYAVSRKHFIQLMELEGYQVNWSDTRKYITYTCPNGMKCRDNKLHEEKYLKEAMTDEFRIRKEIAKRIESSSEDEFSTGRSDRDLCFDYGEELAGADSISADADRYAQHDDEYNGNSGDMERPLGYAAGAVGQVDFSSRGNAANSDRVSGFASKTSTADSDSDIDLNGDLPITGWESERELLTTALLSGADNETQLEADDLGFAYPDYPVDHLGIDSAYLAAELMNIIDNDTHTEDCTTNKKPRHEHKNTLGGM
ncbi:relaxase/mobilization nuclease domain-containing protein [Lachnoclostridium sp. MSJ-17]|uniref:relaxase/mobilization nuclease domain-containing protein n=1 Tax=Lachnoclostridium sp. MSJ-17 TaxID=2841516 RepID=UPI001C116C45|nr:relaxase/mobilization nuclease domain-containing protein [Lachnoclostridium sp. MSJ-17]